MSRATRRPPGGRGTAPAKGRGASAGAAVEAQVLGNIKAQRLGPGTIGDLDLPPAFLSRAADRVIRRTFAERYRMVVADEPAGAPAGVPQKPPGAGAAAEPAPVGVGRTPDGRIVVVERQLPEAVLAERRALKEGRPGVRGYRAPVRVGGTGEPAAWPLDEPGGDGPEELRRAAQVVARRLARDGLLSATAQAIEVLGPGRFAGKGGGAPGIALLRAAGLPVDLLAFFRPPVREGYGGGGAIVRWIAQRLNEADGVMPARLRGALQKVPFQFAPSRPGFGVATESGEHAIGTIRLQLTRGTDWAGVGDGGALDVARQLVAAAPGASFLVSIERRHLADFLRAARGWALARPGQMVVIPEDLPVAQWAQDSGKAGLVEDGAQAHRPATIVARYAGRGEEGSIFVPGETFLAEGLAAAGHEVIRSPLLFQGGNLLAVQQPRTGERVLLVGEAEVYRNVALGLTRPQVLAAMGVEFGVDRCVVLPAASYHIDYEVCVRAAGEGLVAFVNDTPTAARIVLGPGVAALETAGHLTGPVAGAAREHLAAGRVGEFVGLVWPAVGRGMKVYGQFPESLARAFAGEPGRVGIGADVGAGGVDSGVGNLQRFLLALDLVVSESARADEAADDGHTQAMLRSLARRQQDRRMLRQHLKGLGCRVVLVPSLAEGERSLCAINGIQTKGRYFMPAYGGLFAALDEAAAAVFQREMGPTVEVVRAKCAESQRRDGAVHCAAAVYPG